MKTPITFVLILWCTILSAQSFQVFVDYVNMLNDSTAKLAAVDSFTMAHEELPHYYSDSATFLMGQSVDDQLVESLKKNTVYFEMLGNGGLYSLNYDRIFFNKQNLSGFFRIGGSEWHAEDTDTLNFVIIFEVGLLVGGPKHFLDLGFGYSYFTNEADRLIVPRAGYRFKGHKGFTLRISPAMYIINQESGSDSFGGYWIGLGIGYSF